MGNILAQSQSKKTPQQATFSNSIIEDYLHQHPSILQMGDKDVVMILQTKFPNIGIENHRIYIACIAKCRVENYDLLLA